MQNLLDREHPLGAAAWKIISNSDYAARHIEVIKKLLTEDDCQRAYFLMDYQQQMSQVSFDLTPHQYASALRQFRHRHLLRIALREMAGLSNTIETLHAWSDCAEVIILTTLDYCKHQLAARFGHPKDASGSQAQLYTLAMGKLGGRELNFSSDIDLIFAFSEMGHTDGQETVSNQLYYTKVIQLFIQLLQHVTPEGFVFRVDLRLRPNGESGPLVYSLASLETYYQEQGRDWERYAMVKARLLGQAATLPWFNRLITPFVYRRYIDFSVIEALRSMKALIEREVQLNPLLDDIKRGHGGIREVEFIIQSVQLIRGGRIPAIRQQNALQVLTILEQQTLLPNTEELQRAYLFLRRLENMLQLQNDQQTHALPRLEAQQKQIWQALNFPSWKALIEELHAHQRIIRNCFKAILSQVDRYEDEKRVLSNQLLNVWQGHVETGMAIQLLLSLGFTNPERCYQLLHAFRHGPRCRRLTQVARLRLDRFMVALLHELLEVRESDEVLLHVLRLLEQICARSAYLALLCENLEVLKELLYWFAHSPFITALFINQPFLLEVLIDQEASWRPLPRHQLNERLQAQLAPYQENEAIDEQLRQFKLSCWLLAARAELYQQCDAVRMGTFLADVAEVLINAVIERACQQLYARHPDIHRIKKQFAVVAYGKLGSREMNYDSDVDLVFLHSVAPEREWLVTRLCQKILHMLTTRTQSGVLYTVDTRLRPSGSAGLLVSRIDAFTDYQKNQAWTWEHQALVRARVIFGGKILRAQFKMLKFEVLNKPRILEQLSADVQTMRAKINQNRDQQSIKHIPGGLLDIEFLTQYLVLLYPSEKLCKLTHTLAQLRQLREQGVLDLEHFKILAKGYETYHRLLHRELLQPGEGVNDEQAYVIYKIWQNFITAC